LLEEAAQSDWLVAKEKLIAGEAPAALAHLARAISYEPISKTARLWDTDTGKLLTTLQGHEGPVYSAQFTPDEKRILTASDDRTARLWDTDSGKLLATLQGHDGPVYSAQFTPDGKAHPDRLLG
jgi:WD40 repeat protein